MMDETPLQTARRLSRRLEQNRCLLCGRRIQIGCVAGTMEVEQFSRVLSRRSGERKVQCLGSVEDEDTTAGGVELGKSSAAGGATAHFSKSARSGAPPFRIGQS